MDDENEILIEEKEASRAMNAYTLPCAYQFITIFTSCDYKFSDALPIQLLVHSWIIEYHKNTNAPKSSIYPTTY